MISPFISKRELARAWQIVRVIGRYGLAPLVQETGVGRFLGVHLWRRIERRYLDIPPPVRLRLALIELGTTFIKLGQVLSARSDLLPPEYLHELSSLQDEIPPLPFAKIEPVFRKEFGCSPHDAYPEFDSTPIASASIGQAYRAVMRSGEEVVVKIQRPGVEEQVNTDLSLVRRVAQFIHRNPAVARFDLPSLVREFSAILQDELLYTLEAHNAETLAREMADHPKIGVPTVFWQYTTRRVITTQYIHGMKVTDLAALDDAGVDRKEIAVLLSNGLLEQILLHGLFHGDPHPGNLLVTPDGRLFFLDTGMVGRLDRKMRELLVELAVSIFDQDIDAVLEHLQQLGVVMVAGQMPDLRRDLAQLITKYYFLPRKELRLGQLLQRVNFLLFEHEIRMAYEFGLMAKALFIVEGVAQELDADFDYNLTARPVIDAVRRQYYSWKSLYEDSVREWRGIRREMVEMPRRMSALLRQIEVGEFRLHVHDDSQDTRLAHNNLLVNRVIITLLTLGILFAATFLLALHPGATLHYFAIVMLAVDGVLMVILLIALLRS